jgi:DNA-binding XRE family transcriptional regulator
MMISADQIRAARGILRWTQEEMAAEANLSPGTIHNLEKSRNLEKCQITLGSVFAIRKACEKHGLEFIDGNGVRCRMQDGIRVYAGYDGCDRFFDEMLETAEVHDDEIVAVARSQDMLCRSLGDEGSTDPKRLSQLSEIVKIKCLLSEAHSISFSTESCQFRFSPKYHVGAAAYFICGDKYAVIMADDQGGFKFVVFESMSAAQSGRHTFQPLWHAAAPLVIQSLARELGRRV